jgi:hypothetical protein
MPHLAASAGAAQQGRGVAVEGQVHIRGCRGPARNGVGARPAGDGRVDPGLLAGGGGGVVGESPAPMSLMRAHPRGWRSAGAKAGVSEPVARPRGGSSTRLGRGQVQACPRCEGWWGSSSRAASPGLSTARGRWGRAFLGARRPAGTSRSASTAGAEAGAGPSGPRPGGRGAVARVQAMRRRWRAGPSWRPHGGHGHRRAVAGRWSASDRSSRAAGRGRRPSATSARCAGRCGQRRRCRGRATRSLDATREAGTSRWASRTALQLGLGQAGALVAGELHAGVEHE